MLPPTYTSIQSLLIASLALETALAVSLNDFTPRVSNLPSACASIYTSQISGCQPSDFSGSGCSQSCITAFNNLQNAVSSACQGVTGQNVLVAFMAGSGTKDLCPNAASSPAKSPAASSQAAYTTNTPAQKSTVAQSTQQATSVKTSPVPAAVPTTTSTASSVVASSAATSSTPEASSVVSTSSVPTTARGTTVVSTATVMPSPDASTMTASDAVPTTLIFATSAPPTSASPMSTSSTISDIPAQATSGGEGSPFDAYSGRKSSAASLPRAGLWTVLAPVMLALTQLV